MKYFKFSISLFVIFAVVNVFFTPVEEFLIKTTSKYFLEYVMIALVSAGFFILLFKRFYSRKKGDIILIVLPFLVLIFFIIKNSLLHYQMMIFQSIIYGSLVALEDRREGRYAAFVLILLFSVFIELIHSFFSVETFFYLDVLINSLICFASFTLVKSYR